MKRIFSTLAIAITAATAAMAQSAQVLLVQGLCNLLTLAIRN